MTTLLPILQNCLARVPQTKLVIGSVLDGKRSSRVQTDEGHLKALQKCQVCALGDLFLGKMLVENKLDFNVVEDDTYYVDVEDIRGKLKSFITDQQMAMIEVAFELLPPACTCEARLSRQLSDRAFLFGYKVSPSNQKTRYQAVLENMLQNNGQFVPPKLTKTELKIYRRRLHDYRNNY